jgi:hypothetical protein
VGNDPDGAPEIYAQSSGMDEPVKRRSPWSLEFWGRFIVWTAVALAGCLLIAGLFHFIGLPGVGDAVLAWTILVSAVTGWREARTGE